MDYNGLREGVTVYLPVNGGGAILLNGDALETSIDVEFTVNLIISIEAAAKISPSSSICIAHSSSITCECDHGHCWFWRRDQCPRLGGIPIVRQAVINSAPFRMNRSDKPCWLSRYRNRSMAKYCNNSWNGRLLLLDSFNKRWRMKAAMSRLIELPLDTASSRV